jgi:polysaccharide export outer membrane protein
MILRPLKKNSGGRDLPMRWIYRIKYLLPLVLFSVIFGACGGKSPESMIPQNTSKNQESKRAEELNRRIIEESAKAGTNDEDYQIGPGDLLDVKVYEAQDLSTEARVSTEGTVTYPLLGEVEIGGLTVHESEKKLQRLLRAKYVKNPHVSIFVKEYRSKKVAVVGAVKNPGDYDLLNQGHLLEAIALAGGLTDNAGQIVYLTHQGTDKQIKIDLDELLIKGNTSLNLPVQMGDTVFVPEAGIYYVNGAVKKGGEFPLKKPVTISRAIEIAGGLDMGARSHATLIRFKEDGEKQIIPVDLNAIRKGKEEDIALQDQDVLYVGMNPLIAFFRTISLGYFFPPFSVSGSPSGGNASPAYTPWY